MPQHRIDTYKEGWSRVEFCTICGAEGLNLNLECVGITSDENQPDLFNQVSEKDIDKDMERFQIKRIEFELFNNLNLNPVCNRKI